MSRRGAPRRRLLGRVILVTGLAAAAAPAAWARPPVPFPPIDFGPHELERCLRCHGIPNFLYRDTLGTRVRDLSIDVIAHVSSVHGSLECTQCHADVRAYPHEFPGGRRAPVGCDADCHATDVEGRTVSHRAEQVDFLAGAHRKGLTGESADSPACVTCHGEGRPHAIPSPRRTFGPRDRMRLCADCHEDRPRMARHDVDPDAVSSYRRSFHYKAVRFGARNTAVCQDCHGVHRVMSPDSTGSRVGADSLMTTCGRKDCHQGANARFAMSGANHLGMRAKREPLLRLEEALLLVLGAAVLLVLLADIVLDAARRWRAARRARASGAPGPPVLVDGTRLVARLTLAQRAQHGALVLAFSVLALTGLPLRYPDSEPLARVYALLGGLVVARGLHRAAAVLMVLVGLVHLTLAGVALVRRRGDLARAWPILPGPGDGRAARELALFQTGRRPLPPASGHFDLRNKLHYLAVAWGLPVMTLSGLVLWFPLPLGARLPELALGVAFLAHSDEALLAIGVVLVWHLYVVHVSPGVHRRFLTWIDGRVTRAHWLLRHPADAESAGEGPVSPAMRQALFEESWRRPPREPKD